jgi:hypothetical protein
VKKIFEHGEFSRYRLSRLDEAMQPITESYQYAARKTTIFLSHKHDELDDLRDIIGFLEHNYNTKVYIDSQDPSMPKVTSGETATRIKDRITKCNKFILLATNDAIESKWCNWELGYGDSKKYKGNIALFPMKDRGQEDYSYRGSEYMSIYPYITYYNGTETYTSGDYVKRGYYVREERLGKAGLITPLEDWLQKY